MPSVRNPSVFGISLPLRTSRLPLINLVVAFTTELRLFSARLNNSSNSAFVRVEFSKEEFTSLRTCFASSTTFLSSTEDKSAALTTAFDNSSLTFFNSSEFFDFSNVSFEDLSTSFSVSIFLSLFSLSFTSVLIDFKIDT